MKLSYALRRGVFYPSPVDKFGEMPPREHRSRYLQLVHEMGFEGVEVGVDEQADQACARDLATELADAGLSVVCVRAGGALSEATAQRRMERAIHYARWTGAGIVNTAMVSPATDPDGPGAQRQGEPVSQGASRTATDEAFTAAAAHLQRFGRMAADAGVRIAIEVHQGSIADNSWATLRLLDLVGLDSVGANPDLGNIYWQYEVPEEKTEAAIVALAPRSVYWHCKNLRRIHIPELHRSLFQRVPLPDGDLDYRFAISAMLAAGYDGYLAVEGVQFGDQLWADRRSLQYVQSLLAEVGGGAP